MSIETNVTGSIDIRPGIPDATLATLRERISHVTLTQSEAGDHTTITDASNEIGDMVHGDRVNEDVCTIVAALGDAHTYTGALECCANEDPWDRWHIRVTDDRQVIEETPLIIYPPDGLVLLREVIEDWTGGRITDAQLIQLGEALPMSEVPQAIDTVMTAINAPTTPAEPAGRDDAEPLQHTLRAAMITAVTRFRPTTATISLGHAEHQPGRGYFLSRLVLTDGTVLVDDDEIGWPLIHAVALISAQIRHSGVLHDDINGAEITLPAPTPSQRLA